MESQNDTIKIEPACPAFTAVLRAAVLLGVFVSAANYIYVGESLTVGLCRSDTLVRIPTGATTGPVEPGHAPGGARGGAR
jgi:hypothetical protein